MGCQVWITGLGAVTPLGNDTRTFTTNLLAGRSGVQVNELAGRSDPVRVSTASVGTIPAPPHWEDTCSPARCAASRMLSSGRQVAVSLEGTNCMRMFDSVFYLFE